GPQAPTVGAMEGCWEAKDTAAAVLKWSTELLGETTSGQCAVDVANTWFLCLTEGDPLTMRGTASVMHQRSAKKVADPAEGIKCTGLVGFGYSQDFIADGKVANGKLRLALKGKNCMFGDCPKRDREVVVSSRDGGISMVLEDQSEISLKKKQ